MFQPHNDVASYSYAEVTVPEEQDVLIKMGSDDDIICWLNGQQIHANPASRGLTVDEDVVPAHLVAGKNTLLVKVLNGAGDYAFCLRLTDRENKPIKFEMAKP